MNEHAHRRDGYRFHLANIDCLRGATSFNVLMHLERSVIDLLPYLAASLPGCSYLHGAEEISLMDSGHIVVIYPERLTLTDVKDLEEADALCRRYFLRICDVAARRDEIEPVYARKNTVSVLQILQAVPRTNCGECGEATCMAFASRVFRREAHLVDCTSLADRTGAVRALLDDLRANGYETGAVGEP